MDKVYLDGENDIKMMLRLIKVGGIDHHESVQILEEVPLHSKFGDKLDRV